MIMFRNICFGPRIIPQAKSRGNGETFSSLSQWTSNTISSFYEQYEATVLAVVYSLNKNKTLRTWIHLINPPLNKARGCVHCNFDAGRAFSFVTKKDIQTTLCNNN